MPNFQYNIRSPLQRSNPQDRLYNFSSFGSNRFKTEFKTYV